MTKRESKIFRSAKELFYGRIRYIVKHFPSPKHKKAVTVKKFDTPEEVEEYCYGKPGRFVIEKERIDYSR